MICLTIVSRNSALSQPFYGGDPLRDGLFSDGHIDCYSECRRGTGSPSPGIETLVLLKCSPQVAQFHVNESTVGHWVKEVLLDHS